MDNNNLITQKGKAPPNYRGFTFNFLRINNLTNTTMTNNYKSKLKLSAWLPLLFLILFAANSKHAEAQVSAYTFVQDATTYTPITGGLAAPTTFNNQWDDITFGPEPIGFPFTFNGVSYTTYYVNTNGFISFGPVFANSYGPISATTGFAGVISACTNDLGDFFNLGGFTSELRLQTIGTAPNRISVIQFKDYRHNWSNTPTTANSVRLNFQIRLYETSNNVEVHYGPSGNISGTTNLTRLFQIGLRGATNVDRNNRLNSTAVSINASVPGTLATSTQAFSSINVTPGRHTNGKVYRWTPPSCGAPGGLSATAITGTTATLNWAAVSGATSYEISLGTTPHVAGPVTYTSATNSFNIPGGLTALTGYQWYVRAICPGPITSPYSPVSNFVTACPATSCNYTAQLWESWGDGWNGANIEFRQNGLLRQVIAYAGTACGLQTVNINVCDATPFEFRWIEGAFSQENSFRILDFSSVELTSRVGSDPGLACGVPSFTGAPLPANNANFLTGTGNCAIPLCNTPTGLNSPSQTLTSVNLAWNASAPAPANGYHIYRQGTAAPAPTGITVPTYTTGAGVTTLVDIAVTSGDTYFYWVRANCGGANGTSTWFGPISVTVPTLGSSCAAPLVISSIPYTNANTTCGKGNNYGLQCSGFYGGGEDAVYELQITTAPVNVQIQLTNTSATNWIGWFLKDAANCATTTPCLANATSGFGNVATGTFNFATNGTYYIIVDTWPAPNCAAYSLNLSIIPPPPPPPANDVCATATNLIQEITCNPLTQNNASATASGVALPTCAAFGVADDDVWFAFVAQTPDVTVQVQGIAGFDAVVAAYASCGGAQLGCADATGGGGLESLNLTGLSVGVTYYVRVFHYFVGAGSGQFSICVFNSPNPCASITPLTCGGLNSYNAVGNGVWNLTPCWFGGTPGQERLYQFTAPATGNYTLQITSASGGWVDYFYKLASSGCNQTGWTCIGDFITPIIGESFGPLTAGQSYYILLDGEGTAATNHTFSIACPPVNNNCNTASALSSCGGPDGCYSAPVSGTTLSASPTPAIDPVDPDVWYLAQTSGYGGNRRIKFRVNASLLLLAGLEVYTNNCVVPVLLCADYAQTQGGTVEVVTTASYPVGAQFRVRVVDLLSGFLGPEFSSNFFTIQMGLADPFLATCIVPPPANDEAEACGTNINGGCPAPGVTLLMQNGSATVSSAVFYDSGGPGGPYSADESLVYTINPTNPLNKIRVSFTGFDVEPGWDKLQIFNGPNTASPLFPGGAPGSGTCTALGNGFSGVGNPGVFTSTAASGAITFRFCSDASFQNSGWTATVDEVDNLGDPVNVGLYSPYAIGDFVQGNVWAECGSRDTDWYEFVIPDVTPVSLNVTSEFPVAAYILNNNCSPIGFRAIQETQQSCVTIQATTVLQPGTYRIFIAPLTFQNIPCGSPRNDYFFQLLAATPPPNDNCALATPITVLNPGSCPGGGLDGTTLAAIEESGRPDPTCSAGNISDVWYTFNSGGNNEIEVFINQISATQVGIELWTDCNTIVPGTCVLDVTDATPVTYTVIPSTIYRLRVFSNFDLFNPGTYKLCVQSKPQPPVNDDICGAITLGVYSAATASPGETTASNFYATNSVQPNPACSGTLSRDMWYRVVVPSSGTVTVNTFAVVNNNPDVALYASSDQTCSGVLTLLACDDQRGPNNAAWAQVNGLLPGTSVFIRIGGRTATARGTFRLSVTEGLFWTGQFTNVFNTIADQGTGLPTNWYCYDGGAFGPGNFSNANISVLLRSLTTNPPNVVGNVNVRNVRVNGWPGSASITIGNADVLNVHGSLNGAALIAPRFLGNGIVRFNSTVPTTHDVSQNWRVFGRMTVAPTSTVNAPSRFAFENNSQLFSNAPAATYGVLNGNISYRRTSNAGFLAYSYWSSPVIGAQLSVLTQAGMGNVYQYDATAATGTTGTAALAGWQVLGLQPLLSIPVTMTPGRGYIATNGGTATFTGAPQQANVDYTPINNGTTNRMNLIGNPYPSNIRAAGANSFLLQNSTRIAGGALYLWDDDNSEGATYTDGDYILYTSLGGTVNGPNSINPFSGRIAAGQGFFVNYAGAGTGPIEFRNTMRDIDGTNAEFFDVIDFKRFRIQLTTPNLWEKDAVIVFKDDATETYHEMYDVLRLPGSPNAAIFTKTTDNEFALKAYPELTSGRIIDLGVVNTFAGSTTLSVTEYINFDATTVVYLEDLALGIFHNLNENNTYVYENQPGFQGTRFRLHFRAPIQTAAYAACTGEANGKLIVMNPNTSNPVNMSVKDVNNNVVAQTGAFIGERVIENLATGNYTLDFVYTDNAAVTDHISVTSTGFNVQPSFTASATEVSIADAIIEFIGDAQGAAEYVWNFGDGTIVTGIINPVHAYMQAGEYEVTFTAINGGCSATASTTVKISNVTTGIGNVASQNDVILYPNPAKDRANILLNIDRAETQVKVSIYDAAGRMISSRNANDLRSGSIITLDVEELANGIYEVVVEGNAFRSVRKLTIAK